MEIQLNQLIHGIGTICCEPSSLTLQPLEGAVFKAVICLKANGAIYSDLEGVMNIVGSTTKIPVSIKCSILSQGPYIITMTPIVHFGFVQLNTEMMKSIAIKNTG